MNSLFNLCLNKIDSFIKNNDEYLLDDHNNNFNDENDEEYYNDNSFETINRSEDSPLSKLYEISTTPKNNNNNNKNSDKNNNKIKFYNTLIKALIERNKLNIDILYQLSLSIPLHFITFLDLKSNLVSNSHCLNISRIKTIRFLNLSNSNKLEDKGIKYLKGLPKLTELDISNCCRLTNRSLKYISLMTRLELLDISNNLDLNDQGFKYLMVLSRLKELIARNVPFTDHSICIEFQNQLNNYNHCGSISIQPFQSLTIINLSNSFISNQSLLTFLQFPSLSTIYLSNSKCTQIALNQFASSNTTSTCNIISNFMTIQLINNNINNINNNIIINNNNNIHNNNILNSEKNNNRNVNNSLKLNNKFWPVDQIVKVILNINNYENNSTNSSLNTSLDSKTSSLNASDTSNDDIDSINENQIFKTPIKRSPNNISPLLFSTNSNKNSTITTTTTASKSPLLNLFDENDFIGGDIKLPLIKDPFSRSPTKRIFSKVHSSPSHLNIYNRVSSKITTTPIPQTPTSLNQHFAFSPLRLNTSIIKKSGGFRTSQTPLISPKPSRKYDFSIYDCNDDEDDEEFSDQEKEIYNTPKKQKIKKQQKQKQLRLDQQQKSPLQPLKLPTLNQSPIILPLSNHRQLQTPKQPQQQISEQPKISEQPQQPKTPEQSKTPQQLKTPEQISLRTTKQTLEQQQPKTPNQSPIQNTPNQSPIHKTPKRTPRQQTPKQTSQLPLLRQTPQRLRLSPQQQQQQQQQHQQQQQQLTQTPLKFITPNKLSSIDINNLINISNNKNNNYTPSKYNCSPEYKKREIENGDVEIEDIEISVIIEPFVETPTKQSKKRKSYPLSASKNYNNYERIDSNQKISKLVFDE
ncbi:hypothetical protein ACTFIV_009827 [Dictyostelium citrinum]